MDKKVPASDRDTLIKDLWLEGFSLREIAECFDVSRSRIAQIIKRLGVQERPEPEPRQKVNAVFVGVTVRPDIKQRLVDEAERRGITVSALVRENLEKFANAG